MALSGSCVDTLVSVDNYKATCYFTVHAFMNSLLIKSSTNCLLSSLFLFPGDSSEDKSVFLERPGLSQNSLASFRNF